MYRLRLCRQCLVIRVEFFERAADLAVIAMHAERPNRINQLASFCVDCDTYLALLFDGGRHDFFFSDPLCAACAGNPLAGVSAGNLEDCPSGAGCTADCDVLAFAAEWLLSIY